MLYKEKYNLKNQKTKLLIILSIITVFSLIVFSKSTEASPNDMVFPVIGTARFTNDFTVPRPKGIHGATDVMAGKGQQLVAAVSGTISYVGFPPPAYGYTVEITDDEGYIYAYLHINDDNPGTNDGKGGAMKAYGPDIKEGNRVYKGQLLGYVGDSGYSNGVPHLHFEIIAPDGQTRINPYSYLVNSIRLNSPKGYPQLSDENLPYGSDFKGGASIAMGNLDQDPAIEFITGPGPGGGPHVRKFSETTALMGNDFMAYNPNFYGGIDVALGDIDNDGVDEIITSPGPGGGPHIKVFKADGNLISQFLAYDENFKGGVDVSSGNVFGTDIYEIISSPGPGGGPHIKVFKADGNLISQFLAYDENFKGGVRVSSGNVRDETTLSEIVTIPASPPGGPHLRMFDYQGFVISERNFMEEWWEGFNDIGAGNGVSLTTTGVNRRTSIRGGIY